jgi:hypothetical protein
MLTKTRASFLQKPYTHDMLAKTVREALDGRSQVSNPPQPLTA